MFDIKQKKKLKLYLTIIISIMIANGIVVARYYLNNYPLWKPHLILYTLLLFSFSIIFYKYKSLND